ncbi:TPA: hypothetical protein OMS07_000310 [Klebsiella aerogenes]|uniref:DUF6971 family protein n=1 Tax=Klebsiella aerogenes TaxID=548 RepID=UPI0022781AD0|nr:hypothetical protein [Klebsiella aerogenes]MCY4763529.1 hypothetical protein [Klebsiella aerogenes]HCD3925220.1 hypothetical protein [Klebsiella aerogenes]HCR0140433.1 hypothetical protein [Klebsiella aerogenes]HCT8366170.1 hypothetical protein [Klebsiella aerogenes]
MAIAYRKLNVELSDDKETVLIHGQEMATKYFCEVVVTTMLNSLGSPSGKTDAILNELHAAGLNAGDYGAYSRWWVQSNAEARAEAERRRKEVQQYQERWEAMTATPAQIAAEKAEKAKRAEAITKRFSRKGAAFGL